MDATNLVDVNKEIFEFDEAFEAQIAQWERDSAFFNEDF